MEGSTFAPAMVKSRMESRLPASDRDTCIQPRAGADDVLRGIVLRVLARFPEAYEAVNRELQLDGREPRNET